MERDELPEEPLVAMVPVSVRTRRAEGTFGNRVSMMLVPIPTDEPDPQARLKRTHEVLRSAKERHQRAAGRPAHGRDAVHPACGRALARAYRGADGAARGRR